MAVVSICPYTKCPPISSPTFNDLSILTNDPTTHDKKFVLEAVSLLTSKNNKLPLISFNVRQIPEQEIEAPTIKVSLNEISFKLYSLGIEIQISQSSK